MSISQKIDVTILTGKHFVFNKLKSKGLFMQKIITTIIAVTSLTAQSVEFQEKLSVEILNSGFEAKTTRLVVKVIDGKIVSLKNLKTGEIHAEETQNADVIPYGLGHMKGYMKDMEKLHSPWGASLMNQDIGKLSIYPTQRHPNAQSRFSCNKTADGVQAEWMGLSNDKDFFPDDKLIVKARIGVKGELEIMAEGESADGGLYGIQVPLTNITSKHKVFIPSFGGMMFDNNDKPSLLTLANTQIFWDAPVIAFEGEYGSIGYWIEDPTFQPKFLFFNWSGNSFSVGMEQHNLMPLENHKKIRSVWWKYDVMDNGWVNAMRPYKEWYAQNFAEELKIRNSIKWADSIRIIIDAGEKTAENLRELAKIIDPKTAMVMEWHARAPVFDQELPDWTPRRGYIEQVRLAQSYGFKTMGYVNTRCVNKDSIVYKRDKIEDWALSPKYWSIGYYSKDNPNYLCPSLKDITSGDLIYIDPLCAKWREYHINMMLKWKNETGTDANYEDCAGIPGDMGNGIIDGMQGAEGTVAIMKDLLIKNPDVPMATEFGPDSVAFASQWPSRLFNRWGNENTRKKWMTSLRPVSTYLFDYRPWNAAISPYTDDSRNIVMACTDSLGGVTQMHCFQEAFSAVSGTYYHMRERAKFFSEKQLIPYFPNHKWEDNLVCHYKDKDDGIYRYYSVPGEQKMVGPDGNPIYARVTNKNTYKSVLKLSGWPAQNENTIVGLDPAIIYALHKEIASVPELKIKEMPEGIMIRNYREGKRYCIISLGKVTENSMSSGKIVLDFSSQWTQIYVNDKIIPSEAIRNKPVQVTFPAQLLLLKKASDKKSNIFLDPEGMVGLLENTKTGLIDCGSFPLKEYDKWSLPEEKNTFPIYRIIGSNFGNIVIDYLINVPDKNSSFLFYFQNISDKIGDCSIITVYINGNLIREFDFLPQNKDWKQGMNPQLRYENSLRNNDLHRWTIPLGSYMSSQVLLTIKIDSKDNINADKISITKPILVKDQAQLEKFEQYKNGKYIQE